MTAPLEHKPQWTHVAPSRQPTQVHELTGSLFPAYTIDDGSVQLAGCTLEDRLIVQLSFQTASGEPVEVYVADNGQGVDERTACALGLKDVVPLKQPRLVEGGEIDRLVDRGKQIAQDRLGDAHQSLPPDGFSTVLIWCKFAEGKLRFNIGEHSAEAPFAGWAQTLTAQPFHCPLTGVSSFHLAATDDGRITVAEAIRTCDESGRRALEGDLVRCSITGKTILPQFAETCPVSGVKVLRTALTVCPMCGQGVSPASIVHGRCAGCRSLKSVSQDDPTMVRVYAEYPGLDRWRRWQIAETATVYILVASGLFKRLLVVMAKESLDLLQLATGIRFFLGWTAVDPALYDEVLQ